MAPRFEDMDRQEVYDLVTRWIDEGSLIQKSSLGGASDWYHGIWRQIGAGALFFTSNSRVLAKDRGVRDDFQRLVALGRVMTYQEVTIRHPECSSIYLVNKMAERGALLKIDRFSSAVLFIE